MIGRSVTDEVVCDCRRIESRLVQAGVALAVVGAGDGAPVLCLRIEGPGADGDIVEEAVVPRGRKKGCIDLY